MDNTQEEAFSIQNCAGLKLSHPRGETQPVLAAGRGVVMRALGLSDLGLCDNISECFPNTERCAQSRDRDKTKGIPDPCPPGADAGLERQHGSPDHICMMRRRGIGPLSL